MKQFSIGLILGILISVAVYVTKASNYRDIDGPDSKIFNARMSLTNFNTAIGLYYGDKGRLPDNEKGLEDLFPKYIEGNHRDPWGSNYFYATFIIHEQLCFVLWSYGSDLKPGGVGPASDIFLFSQNGNCFKRNS